MKPSMFRACVALAAALALPPAASAASLIVNGSFEQQTGTPFTGTFVTLPAGSTQVTGWTIEWGSIDYINAYWQPADGSYSVDLFGNAQARISQTFATTVGQQYQVSFQYSVNPDNYTANTRGVIYAAVDGVGAGPVGNFAYTAGPNSRASMNWQSASFTFTATGAATTLRFSAYDVQNPGQCCWGAALDNVAVAAVPEPHEWAMMLAGLGMVGVIARRRRAAARSG
jgi:choice-of-anchor C domain-containing protein